MNKKLLSAAIVAAFAAAPAAYADAVVYGKAHVSIDAVDYETTGGPVYGASDEDNYHVASRSSRLGFKGSEDLGNGLKAIYQYEFSVDVDANNGLGGRNTFIGLAGDWGTFLVGKHDTPQKLAFYASGNELLGDSAIDLNRSDDWSTNSTDSAAPIGVFHEMRANNAIAYVTPNFSGFTGAVAIIPGEGNTSDTDGLADSWSAGLMYSGNGLKASVGYIDYAEVGTKDTDVLQVGASYQFNNFQIGAQYEDSDDILADVDYKAWAVTGKFTFGNNALSLVYTDSETDGAANDEETQGWGLAAEHNFSKRTKVYAAYASNEVDVDNGGDDGDQDVFSLGMIHSF